ncbi:unnamed protein product [Oncorhynchus mykiss]|uniref:Uncharacterized protein n=1 Tax=Oncorhynchus mykiss TaxID=8022 RepID=A0A060Z9V9_ONCMY|nr:unnamed protein product [Oncorhynchus mykiss]
MTPTRAKVGDTVRITVQGFQVGAGVPGVSAWGFMKPGGHVQFGIGRYRGDVQLSLSSFLI